MGSRPNEEDPLSGSIDGGVVHFFIFFPFGRHDHLIHHAHAHCHFRCPHSLGVTGPILSAAPPPARGGSSDTHSCVWWPGDYDTWFSSTTCMRCGEKFIWLSMLLLLFHHHGEAPTYIYIRSNWVHFIFAELMGFTHNTHTQIYLSAPGENKHMLFHKTCLSP